MVHDDVAREHWRRGLAFVLNKSDTASQWHRDFEDDPESTWKTDTGENRLAPHA